MYTTLIRLLRYKEGSMPTYIPQNRQGYNIEISPSDDLRQLIKVVPFYTGTNIMFDLLLTIFKGNKITEDFKIKWGLYDSKNIKIDSGTCAITLNDIKSTRWDWIKFWEYFKKKIEAA